MRYVSYKVFTVNVHDNPYACLLTHSEGSRD